MIEHVVRIQPRSVFDIGHGYGKWGLLIREALDFVPGRLERDEWIVRIDGVDAFRQESPLLEWVYDDLQVADVISTASSVRDYDLVVLGDVIEHLEKEAGRTLLAQLLTRNRSVLLTTPVDFFEQGAIGGNPYERHRSHWTPSDFSEWQADVDLNGGALTVALQGANGSYPSRGASSASRIVQRVPGLHGRGAAARAVKEALRQYVFRAT